MTVLILLREQLPNFGHGKLRKVMEKVMESQGILKGSKSMSPVSCLNLHQNLCSIVQGENKIDLGRSFP